MQREGVNVRFFSGDGVVKNVPEDKAAVFEVGVLGNSTDHTCNDFHSCIDCAGEHQRVQ